MSFHKPKVYRSVEGCCICKAKSSSSRFTDSDKYSDTFQKCFHLTEPREGDICNACVLLVKRFRKLPKGSKKNWAHVVNARAGPGVKSFVRRLGPEKPDIPNKHKHVYKRKKKAAAPNPTPPPPTTDPAGEDFGSGGRRQTSSPFRRIDSPLRSRINGGGGRSDSPLSMMVRQTESPMSNYSDDLLGSDGCSRAATPLDLRQQPPPTTPMEVLASPLRELAKPATAEEKICGFFDTDDWKREDTCCGPIFRGPFGEVMLDRRYYRPCLSACRRRQTPAATSAGDRLSSPTTFPLNTASSTAAFQETVTGDLTQPVEIADVAHSAEDATNNPIESLIASELKAFGLEEAAMDEEDGEEEEEVDFYCSESISDLKNAAASAAVRQAAAASAANNDDEIDEGFYDKPTATTNGRSRTNPLRLSCDSPPTPLSL